MIVTPETKAIDAGLSVRCERAVRRLTEDVLGLRNWPVVTLADIAKVTQQDLLSTRNFGVISLRELQETLAAAGLALGGAYRTLCVPTKQHTSMVLKVLLATGTACGEQFQLLVGGNDILLQRPDKPTYAINVGDLVERWIQLIERNS